MREDWIVADRHLSKISISSNPNNEPVSIDGYSDHLRVYWYRNGRSCFSIH